MDAEQGSGTAPGTPMSGRFNPEDNYKTFPSDGHFLRKAFRSNPYNKVRSAGGRGGLCPGEGGGQSVRGTEHRGGAVSPWYGLRQWRGCWGRTKEG